MIKRFLILILFVVTSNAALSAETIHVGIFFGVDSSLSIQGRNNKAVQYNNLLNGALINSGITGRSFLVYPVHSSISVNPPTKKFDELLAWIENENGNLTSTLRLARDNIAPSHGGLDLLLLVASDIKSRGSTCGAAFGVPITATNGRSELNAFGFVLEHSACLNSLANNIAHEIGHMLYAEHEASSNSTDSNFNLGKPGFINHGYRTAQLKSIMVGEPDVTPSNYRFSGSSGLDLDPIYSDVKLWLQGYVWDTVAAYRKPPPPPQPILSINWINGGCSNSIFEVTISLPNGSVIDNCSIYNVSADGGVISTLASSSVASCVITNLPDDSYYSAQCSNGVSIGEMSAIEEVDVPGCLAGPGSGGWNGNGW